MQLVDILLWLLAVLFLAGNPVIGVLYIAFLIAMYREKSKVVAKEERDKKHNELIDAIKNKN